MRWNVYLANIPVVSVWWVWCDDNNGLLFWDIYFWMNEHFTITTHATYSSSWTSASVLYNQWTARSFFQMHKNKRTKRYTLYNFSYKSMLELKTSTIFIWERGPELNSEHCWQIPLSFFNKTDLLSGFFFVQFSSDLKTRQWDNISHQQQHCRKWRSGKKAIKNVVNGLIWWWLPGWCWKDADWACWELEEITLE